MSPFKPLADVYNSMPDHLFIKCKTYVSGSHYLIGQVPSRDSWHPPQGIWEGVTSKCRGPCVRGTVSLRPSYRDSTPHLSFPALNLPQVGGQELTLAAPGREQVGRYGQAWRGRWGTWERLAPARSPSHFYVTVSLEKFLAE